MKANTYIFPAVSVETFHMAPVMNPGSEVVIEYEGKVSDMPDDKKVVF